jgi:hypothetical protein
MEAVGMWLILARDGMRVECKTGGGMVYLIIGIIGVLWVSGNLLAGAEELVPFEFKGRTGPANLSQGSTRCSFEGMKLPENVRVYAAGNYSGRKLNVQIDQSGHEATQMDIAINSPSRPVVLLLGAYEPTIWNIGWVSGTDVLAVLASGYHRQAVAGLPRDVPVLISTHDNKGACGYFYISEQSLGSLNPLSRRVFERPVDEVFLARDGAVVVGEVLGKDAKIVTSPHTPPASYFDKNAPLAGPAGLEDAVARGLLRKAENTDVEAWVNAVMTANPNRDVPPIAGQGRPAPPKPSTFRAYVVLKEFVFPAGLYGGNSATFFIPKGVPMPIGDPGHSAVYDFNTLRCHGAVCGHFSGY